MCDVVVVVSSNILGSVLFDDGWKIGFLSLMAFANWKERKNIDLPPSNGGGFPSPGFTPVTGGCCLLLLLVILSFIIIPSRDWEMFPEIMNKKSFFGVQLWGFIRYSRYLATAYIKRGSILGILLGKPKTAAATNNQFNSLSSISVNSYPHIERNRHDKVIKIFMIIELMCPVTQLLILLTVMIYRRLIFIPRYLSERRKIQFYGIYFRLLKSAYCDRYWLDSSSSPHADHKNPACRFYRPSCGHRPLCGCGY